MFGAGGRILQEGARSCDILARKTVVVTGSANGIAAARHGAGAVIASDLDETPIGDGTIDRAPEIHDEGMRCRPDTVHQCIWSGR